MTAIAASSHTSRVLVDGTLVLQVHVEPGQRDAAMRLFGAPGTPMALAALKTKASYPEIPDSSTAKPQDQLGPLCLWAVQRCRDPEFMVWLSKQQVEQPPTWNEASARTALLKLCGITSRRYLDEPETAVWFRGRVMRPYRDWLAEKNAEVAPA